MNQAISKTIKISAVIGAMLFGSVDANAQAAYTGDTGHYLQAPQGYQQSATTTSARPIFNGQGMGRGQMNSQTQGQQQAAATQPAAPLTVTTTPASSRMLPQGYTQGAVAPQAMQTQQTAPVAQPGRIQTASVPSAQPSVQALAAMEPAAGSAFDSNTNVSVAPSCGTPGNHRQHKGINTSTTVGNDCFD